MKKYRVVFLALAIAAFTLNPKLAKASNVGDFDGGVAIGSSYAGVDSAPTNGAIIQGNVGIGSTSPAATLDVNGSISGQGPAGDASTSTFNAPTGGNTTITSFTTNYSVGGGFTASTGVFQPTVAGRYLFTVNVKTGAGGEWVVGMCDSGSGGCDIGGGATCVTGTDCYANDTHVYDLNGSTDNVTFLINNLSGSTITFAESNVTWTKIP